jgi:hypothetical protein
MHKETLDLHRDRRSYPGKGVDHQADHGPVAQTGKGSDVDRVDQVRASSTFRTGGKRFLWTPTLNF